MELKDVLKRIIDTCNYSEMNIDSEMNTEYVCMLVEPLAFKQIEEVNKLIVFPLMDQYSDAVAKDEKEYIQDTINTVYKYMMEKQKNEKIYDYSSFIINRLDRAQN